MVASFLLFDDAVVTSERILHNNYMFNYKVLLVLCSSTVNI